MISNTNNSKNIISFADLSNLYSMLSLIWHLIFIKTVNDKLRDGFQDLCINFNQKQFWNWIRPGTITCRDSCKFKAKLYNTFS